MESGENVFSKLHTNDGKALACKQHMKGPRCMAWHKRMLTSNDHFVSKNATPTIVNSTGMNTRRKWKAILRRGHPLDLSSLYDRGDNTSVSHAATVNVQTKKYF